MSEDKEGNIFIGDKTGISVAVVTLIVASVYFIVNIAGNSEANAGKISAIDQKHEMLRRAYIEHSRIMDDNVSDMRADIGEVKGMLKVLIDSQKDRK